MLDGSFIWNLQHPSDVFSVTVSPDGKILATACYDGEVRLWRVNTGQLLKSISFRRSNNNIAAPHDVAISPDGSRIITGSFGAPPRVYEVVSVDVIGSLGSGTSNVTGIAYSPDGKVIALTRDNHGAVLYYAQNSQLLVQLIAFSNGDWAVVDSAGRYDVPNGADIAGLHWVVGLESNVLNQLKECYFEPGLLANKLGFNLEPVRNVTAFTDPKLFPGIEIEPLDE